MLVQKCTFHFCTSSDQSPSTWALREREGHGSVNNFLEEIIQKKGMRRVSFILLKGFDFIEVFDEIFGKIFVNLTKNFERKFTKIRNFVNSGYQTIFTFYEKSPLKVVYLTFLHFSRKSLPSILFASKTRKVSESSRNIPDQAGRLSTGLTWRPILVGNRRLRRVGRFRPAPKTSSVVNLGL